MRLRVIGLAGLLGGVAAVSAAMRRWASTPDLSGGVLLLPEGREHTVERPDGTRLAVLDAGPEDGAPVFVLAHCWTGDRRVWGPVARRLVKAGARVVVYDHRGHGGSSLDCQDHALATLGDDLAAVLDSVAAERVVLVGHSMGGMAVQAFLQGHPQLAARKVAALGFVATATDRQRPSSRIEAALTPRLIGSSLSDFGLRGPLAPVWVRFTVGRSVCGEHLRAVIEPYLATPPAARRAFLESIYEMDYTEVLRKVRVPAVIVCGTRDQVTRPSRMRWMAEQMPHARFVELRDAGHMLPQEEPDRVTAALLDLAAEAGLAPSRPGEVLDLQALEHSS